VSSEQWFAVNRFSGFPAVRALKRSLLTFIYKKQVEMPK
jgi:hypothetical protein